MSDIEQEYDSFMAVVLKLRDAEKRYKQHRSSLALDDMRKYQGEIDRRIKKRGEQRLAQQQKIF